MDLSSLRVRTKNKKLRRVGRGTGSGRGGRSGRGNKGAGQRSGKKLPYVGFRGGNLPLARTLPKRGFTPPQQSTFQLVNLKDLQSRVEDVSEITPEVLKKLALIKSERKPIKILAHIKEDFTRKVVVKADAFSKRAKTLIENAGGKAECLKR